MKLVKPLLFVLGLSAIALVQAQTKKEQALTAELDKFYEKYRVAQNAYYAPYQNVKTPEEASKIKLDPKKDPNRLFWKQAVDLAKKVTQYPNLGPRVEGFVLTTCSGAQKAPEIADSLARIEKFYLNSTRLNEALYQVSNAYRILHSDPKKALAASMNFLARIERNSKLPDNQALALYLRANMVASPYSDQQDKPTGVRLLEQLKTKYPKSQYAKRAEGMLNSLLYLNIGQQAPDFEAVDQDGTKWKLSDYRGKVVIVDFWGFW